MNHSLKIAAGLSALALTVGCAGGDEAEAESSPEPAPTVTVTETATPSPEPTPESAPEDEWLDEIWDEHVDGIIDWWTLYYHVSDCTAAEPECFDVFEQGYELMDDYKDAITDDDPRRPSYVDADYRAEVVLAIQELNLWRVDCLIGTDQCSEQSAAAHDAVEDVMNTALGWYEIEDGQRVTD